MEENKELEVIPNTDGVNDIKIADEVIAVIAGEASAKVNGVFAMAGGFVGGISEVFKGKKNYAKGIKVEAIDQDVKIFVSIVVEYGIRIPDVAFEIQNKVKKAVESMTGLKVLEVNVHVQGVNTEVSENPENTENA